MRRAIVSMVLLLGVLVLTPLPAAGAAPYCGIVWGSLDKAARVSRKRRSARSGPVGTPATTGSWSTSRVTWAATPPGTSPR